MPDCGFSISNPASCIPGGLAKTASDVGTGGWPALQSGAEEVMKTTMGWWVNVPSIDLAATPVQQIQGQVRWLAVVVAVAGTIWQGFRMTVTRKPTLRSSTSAGASSPPLWSAIGIVGVQIALSAADAYSVWILDTATGGQVEEKLTGLAAMAEVRSSGAVIVLSLLMIVAGIAQAILMFFREGAIIVLSGLVVLAAAGSFTASTRPWLHKWLSWMLALVLYKPVAATVYAVAVQVMGDGTDTRTIFIGLAMVVMSLIALPTMMKLFSFAVPVATVAGAGGMAMMGGAATAGIYAAGMRGIPQGGSVEQAKRAHHQRPRPQRRSRADRSHHDQRRPRRRRRPGRCPRRTLGSRGRRVARRGHRCRSRARRRWIPRLGRRWPRRSRHRRRAGGVAGRARARWGRREQP